MSNKSDQDGEKERIVAAAILQDGVVYTGTRHHLIIRDIVTMTGTRPVTGKQGFVTSANRFVDRSEAGVLAKLSGQITELKYQVRFLFSEELWDIPPPLPPPVRGEKWIVTDSAPGLAVLKTWAASYIFNDENTAFLKVIAKEHNATLALPDTKDLEGKEADVNADVKAVLQKARLPFSEIEALSQEAVEYIWRKCGINDDETFRPGLASLTIHRAIKEALERFRKIILSEQGGGSPAVGASSPDSSVTLPVKEKELPPAVLELLKRESWDRNSLYATSESQASELHNDSLERVIRQMQAVIESADSAVRAGLRVTEQLRYSAASEHSAHGS